MFIITHSAELSVADVLVSQMLSHARFTKDMHLTELCYNLADNLACDREVSKNKHQVTQKYTI